MLRASWKGYLRLSRVSCAIALYPTSTTSERIALRMLDTQTSHGLRGEGIEDDGGDLVETAGRMHGDDAARACTIELFEAEADGVRSLVIESFVPRGEVDEAHLGGTYYAAPDGAAAVQTFAILCGAMRRRDVAAIGRTMLHRRERIMLIEPREQGLMATLIRYGYAVCGDALFDEIASIEPARDLIDPVDVVRRGSDPNAPPGSAGRGRGKPH